MLTRQLAFASIAWMSFAPSSSAQPRDSTWTIRAGTYDGRVVAIDRDLATRRGSAFLRLSKLKGDGRFVAWNPSRLPARVAFRPGRAISLEDSAAFWSILNRMEADIGMRLFEPATVSSGSDPDDVIIVDTKAMSGDDGRTYLTWSNDAGVYDARVFFGSRAILRSPRIVTHEMMHALGFGHTSAWISIMNAGAHAPFSLTLADVAYAQYAFASRSSNERDDMWERLALANDREPGSAARVYPSLCRTSPFSVLAGITDCVPEPHFTGAIGASGTSH
jgi:hypothetical protein